MLNPQNQFNRLDLILVKYRGAIGIHKLKQISPSAFPEIEPSELSDDILDLWHQLENSIPTEFEKEISRLLPNTL